MLRLDLIVEIPDLTFADRLCIVDGVARLLRPELKVGAGKRLRTSFRPSRMVSE
jgi:hypothetical protein